MNNKNKNAGRQKCTVYSRVVSAGMYLLKILMKVWQKVIKIEKHINIKNNMKTLFKSASKIVFLLMAIALIGLTAWGKVEAKDFVMLAGMAFVYYFQKDAGAKNK